MLTAKNDSHGLDVREAEPKDWRINKSLYHIVGGPWQWNDRLVWTDEEWRSYAESDQLRTWVGYFQEEAAGYYELAIQEGGDVEIGIFGLAESYLGRGFGGYLLSHAISTAWQIPDTKRVWVHTCTFDHPSALMNYQARGMRLYREEKM